MKKNYQKMAGGIIIFSLAALFLPSFSKKETIAEHPINCSTPQKACVFKTLLGLETFDTAAVIHNREVVESSLKKGMVWMAAAQLDNGGWGAGTHNHQDVRDPHAV